MREGGKDRWKLAKAYEFQTLFGDSRRHYM